MDEKNVKVEQNGKLFDVEETKSFLFVPCGTDVKDLLQIPGTTLFQPALENGRSSGFSSLTRLPANQECSGFQWVRKRWSYSSGYCERFSRSSLLASCRETGGTVSERKSRGFL